MTQISTDFINDLLRTAMEISTPVRELTKLHGDASYRTYYRAILEDGASFILMQMPEGSASASEEITNFKGRHKELPFINIGGYLKKCGIHVPDVHYYCKEKNVILLQDLGDVLLSRLLTGANDNMRLGWYQRAIELLVEIQSKTASGQGSDCVAFKRSFDSTLLNWEFDHFVEYGIEARLGQKMSNEDKAVFISETRKISKKIEEMPYGFTHRDFQSRNLIVVDGILYIIDFQDALLGPAIYDVVSLLRDSYVRLAPELLRELISYYCAAKKIDLAKFERRFDLIVCQRKLKDAGRFVYIDRVKGNPNFLQFIPTSLGYVEEALKRMSEHQALYEVLKKYIPEWE